MRQDTLVFLLKGDQICLAMKKRGFGAGKLNGMGGKVHDGESIEAAAVREAGEEVGVTIDPKDLTKVAELHFSFEGKPEWEILCHTFCTERWQGEPTESEEMSPRWVAQQAIPYHQMWIDDKYWLPTVLGGNNLKATFEFNNDGSKILRYEIQGGPRELWTSN